MKTLVGRIVRVERPTHTGAETIVGAIVTPLVIEEHEGHEVITHVSVEGEIIAETITGVSLPITVERPVTLEMIPAHTVELL
jgi:hypothetical protein